MDIPKFFLALSLTDSSPLKYTWVEQTHKIIIDLKGNLNEV